MILTRWQMAREGGNVYKRQQKQKIKVKSVIQVDRSIKNSKKSS